MLVVENLKKLFMSAMYLGFEWNADTYSQQENLAEQSKQSKDNDRNDTQLSPEKQKVLDEISNLKKELEWYDATKKFTEKAGSYLARKLSPDDYKDPEAKQTIELLESYKSRFLEAVNSSNEVKLKLGQLKQDITGLGDNFEYQSGINMDNAGEVSKNKFSQEKMKTITNSEFLSASKEERLQYVTKGNIDYENVASGDINSLTFNFDSNGDGSDNPDLYRLTTAGQVFGEEVGELKVGEVTYSRSGLDGEFFNGNSRLTIHTGTEITIPKVRTAKEITTLENQINTSILKYTENSDIAREALERWMDPKMVMELFFEILKDLKWEEREIKLEELFTQVERNRWDLRLDANSDALKKSLKDENKDGELDMTTSIDIDFSHLESGELKGYINTTASALWISPKMISSILMQESAGKLGATRFEPHVYRRQISKGQSPENAKLLATSFWGFQIMWFNYKAVWFSSVQDFVAGMQSWPEAQFKAFANFVTTNPRLYQAMKWDTPNFATIARIYNWPNYSQNDYDNKIKKRFYS